MKTLKAFLLQQIGMLIVISVATGQTPIVIDSQFEDWNSVPIAYSSPSGTGATGQIDFRRLRVANDQQFLFIEVDLGKEIILQESNNLQLMIDTDLNASTGIAFNGIGAELIWSFGQRSGQVQLGGQTTSISQSDIRLRSAPSVSSSVFEFAIARNTQINGMPLFPGSTVRLLLRDGLSGDRIPLSGDIVQHTFQSGSITINPTTFSRIEPGDLRIMSWNVRNDGPWNATHAPRFGRILQSTQPDIINFQEIYGHSAAETVAFVSSWLGPASPNGWYVSSNTDCFTVSRYPILGSWPVSSNNAMLIDTTEKFGRPTFLVNAHLPCCSNNASRQGQIDAILAFIRNAKSPGGVLTLDTGTPMIIVGDLNLVTFASQLNSLLNGQIVNQGTHGPSFTPDWDGQPFANLVSRHSDKRMAYTWRNTLSDYSPGILDFQIYTSSVLQVPKHFLVNTEAMSNPRLSSNGLLWNDSWASDHFAFIADYRVDLPEPATIVNQSVFHGSWISNPPGDPWDAIDPWKVLAKEGQGPQMLTTSNLINTAQGINGIVFDIDNLWNPEGLSASDFLFQISPQGAFSSGGHPPASWAPAPSPSGVSVTEGSPNRVLIRWPDQSIQNRWLRITVLANTNTGLEQPEVFYIGHLLGKTTSNVDVFFTVTFTDVIPIRASNGQFVESGNVFDIDKNGFISFGDISAMRSNIGGELTNLTIP